MNCVILSQNTFVYTLLIHGHVYSIRYLSNMKNDNYIALYVIYICHFINFFDHMRRTYCLEGRKFSKQHGDIYYIYVLSRCMSNVS